MALQNFSIEIYDTTLPAWELVPLEYAEATTINLGWSGTDSKMQLIKASVLDFSMEVNMAQPTSDEVGFTTDAWFSNLFTGNETKFAVFIKDEDTGATVWNGFLLPEQYREPYTQGTFYVNFTATDGLARLRGKELPAGMYRGRSSIAHIIANCLKLTGLNKQIYVAQAIDNAGQSGIYKHIDKWFYNLSDNETKGRKKDAFAILEDILTLMGCTLFQQDNRWYVVGWNKFNKQAITFDVYSPDGLRYNTTQSIKRRGRIIKFEATPDVSIKAPFKRVIIGSPFDSNLMLFPENSVEQKWTQYDSTQISDWPRHWRYLDFSFSNRVTPFLNDFNYQLLTDLESGDPPLKRRGNIGFWKWEGDSTSYTRWMVPSVLPYVLPGMRLKLLIEMAVSSASIVNLEGVDNDNLKYDIRINDNVLWSNRGLGNNLDLNFGEVAASAPKKVQATIDIEEFTVEQEGFLSLRVYPFRDFNDPLIFHIEKFDVELIDPEINDVVITRDIDFVTETSLSPQAKDTIVNAPNNVVVDAIRTGFVWINWFTPLEPTIIPVLDDQDFKRNWSNFIGIPASSYNAVSTNILKLFLKRKDSDYYEYLPGAYIHRVNPGEQGFLALNHPDDYKIQEGDSLYYKPDVSLPLYNGNLLFSRQQWKKTEADTGNKRLHECLAEVVHDIHPRELIQMEGDVEGLLFPLDQMKFYYKNNLRSLMALRIDITMDRGVTRLTAIEDITQKVEDYV